MTLLQLDPGLGLTEEMLIEIAARQYRIVKAKDDLATIEPPVPAGGLAAGTRATKVEAFRPFDSAPAIARSITFMWATPIFSTWTQRHGSSCAACRHCRGEVLWEYWGKDDDVTDPNDADPRWRRLEPEGEDDPDALIVRKPKGAIEPTQVGTAQGRWIRARLASSTRLVKTDKVSVRINPREDETKPPPALTDPHWRELPPLEAIAHITPSPTSNVYLLGREPRLFDTLYLGSAEAFSKPGATAWIMFELADGVFNAMTALDGWLLGRILACVDQAGALHLFTIGANGELSRLGGRQPMQPIGAAGGDNGVKLTSSNLRPATWLEGFGVSVAVVAQDQVWVRTEAPPFLGDSKWQSWGAVPSEDPAAPIDALVAIDDGGAKTVVALRNGMLFKSVRSVALDWVEITPNLAANEVVVGVAGLRHETLAAVASRLLVIAQKTTNQKCRLYSVAADGTTTSLLADVVKDVSPFGIERSNGSIGVVAVKEGGPRRLWAKAGTSPSVTAPLEPQMTIDPTSIEGHLEGGQLVTYCLAKAGAAPVLLSWLPFDPEPEWCRPLGAGQSGTGRTQWSGRHFFHARVSTGEEPRRQYSRPHLVSGSLSSLARAPSDRRWPIHFRHRRGEQRRFRRRACARRDRIQARQDRRRDPRDRH